jgi:hypothetical protein
VPALRAIGEDGVSSDNLHNAARSFEYLTLVLLVFIVFLSFPAIFVIVAICVYIMILALLMFM